ncbi:hypothetical protein CMV24_29875 [Pseudomonas plecoglossicida]|uniref:Uncharacterized protein n=1 Tax=Pseudomonas plecoglossicida TaxID=70775 RepID=A0A2A3LVP1_PSEDL|nr:hypothetical protein [Pseudomonas plecoglossicida]PBJ91920.1 hypothetical protein CMV24_29875 [Pseudomonas plecoglossicida]
MNNAEQMHALAIGEVMSQLRQLAKSPTPVPDQTFVIGMLEGFEKIGLFDHQTLTNIRNKVFVTTTQRVEQLRESA